jgi:hypothetical protein
LETNTCLKELTLKSNNIDLALSQIGTSLYKNNTLELLSLFGNNFNEKSGKIFHELLANRIPYIGLNLDVKVYIVDGHYMIAEA